MYFIFIEYVIYIYVYYIICILHNSRRFATVTARTAWKGTIFPPNIAPEVISSRSCFEIGI